VLGPSCSSPWFCSRSAFPTWRYSRVGVVFGRRHRPRAADRDHSAVGGGLWAKFNLTTISPTRRISKSTSPLARGRGLEPIVADHFAQHLGSRAVYANYSRVIIDA
jgi:hypothetical protein